MNELITHCPNAEFVVLVADMGSNYVTIKQFDCYTNFAVPNQFNHCLKNGLVTEIHVKVVKQDDNIKTATKLMWEEVRTKALENNRYLKSLQARQKGFVKYANSKLGE
ncbi:hypothetical protein HWC21_gp096 [Vibrio phage VAP7]|uniref:Uncharacterized protein n=1 Tax=Vibrio phage VAP7 TaxID=2584487 RepID=A0A4Y5TVB7_9CAUD|nr:hypothetical protein HWC21_gp096 [Vibrio phage VAP7]QDB73278.1 hypothetical protein [Vibrio phage VAP7]UFD98037.1 hypothetical protein [Vibrio phage BX-1]